MALSDQALLEQTRLAIDALTTGGASAYTVAGRSVTKLDLPALWKQVEVLEARVARASSGSQATAVRFAEIG
jgi:hypothetical protein